MPCYPVNSLLTTMRPLPAMVAGVLVHLTLGTSYSIGNMAPYIVSYLRVVEGSSITNDYAGWIGSMSSFGQGLTLVLGGILERFVGPRFATLTGSLLVSLGTLLGFVTVKHSFWAVALTYGLLFGFGIGIAYTPPIVCATRWLPRYKGLVIGIIVGGFGCGALIFNQVQTHYINPQNLKPDSDGYFHDKDLLNRVPYAFLMLGGIYLAMQLLAFVLMFDAPKERVEELRQLSHLHSKEFNSIHPRTFIHSPTLLILWLTFLFNGLGVGFIGSYYKLFGQTFIHDDIFLATTGSCASLLNAFGRIFWGHLADHTSYQVSMAVMTSCLSVLYLTIQYTVFGGKPLYMIWVLLIFFTFSGSFVLLPFATAKSAGQTHLGINYGLVFTSQIVASVISAFLAEKLLSVINYNGIFFLVSGFSFISFLLTTLIGITRHGHPSQAESKDDIETRISSDSEDQKNDLTYDNIS